MKNNNFEKTLSEYEKTHPGYYRNYPCPKCGAPIRILYGNGCYTDECTNPKCDFSWFDICANL